MELLRTPDSRFENLPGYSFKPNFLAIQDRSEDVGITLVSRTILLREILRNSLL